MAHPCAYLDAPTPLAFAHRGGAAYGDENTAVAFARAVGLGYRYLETDVRATADGVAVLFHDRTLDRLTGRPGSVDTLRWADLASVRVGGAAAIPRLDETLQAWPQVRFNIDVKSDRAVVPTLDAMARTGAADRILLASFSDARLVRLRALAGPAVATSLGMRGVARLRLASMTGRRLRLPESVVAAQVPVHHWRLPMVDRRLVEHAHRLDLHVHVWTVDEPAAAHHLLDLGVDGIMTDHVGVLREVYASRGLWAA